MVKTMPDKRAKVVVKVTCYRCYGGSIAICDPDNARPEFVHPCPHCHVDGHRTTLDEYQIHDVKITTDEVDALDDWTTVSGDVATDTQTDDFAAVRVRGNSLTERANVRGVDTGTVYQNVQRALSKASN